VRQPLGRLITYRFIGHPSPQIGRQVRAALAMDTIDLTPSATVVHQV
jgi:hypothetical protein